MKKIALVKYAKRKDNIYKVLDLISKDIQLYNKETILIKVALPGFKEIYSNTNVEAVEILISYLKRFPSIKNIIIAEGSQGFYYNKPTTEIFKRFNYTQLERFNVSLLDLDEMEHNETMSVQLIDGTRETVRIVRPKYDYMVSLVPPKTHDFLILSLGMLNMIGFVHPKDKLKLFGVRYEDGSKRSLYSMPRFLHAIRVAHRNLVELVTRIHPDLSIIDGLYGMEGRGPLKGSPVFHGFAIASTDFVKADALCSYVMGFKPDDIGYIHYARKKRLGSTDFRAVIGERLDYVKFPYRAHPNFENQKKWREINNGY